MAPENSILFYWFFPLSSTKKDLAWICRNIIIKLYETFPPIKLNVWPWLLVKTYTE